jgi:N-acetylmuramoyl-L-alanine amidase
MNRTRYPAYPNTVHGVIFDRRNGVQFTPASTGAIYRTPGAECVIAAKLALDGAEVVGNSMFFNMTTVRSWAERNRQYVGTHHFFA